MTITITSIDIDLSEIGRRIDNAYERTQIGRCEWIDGSIDLAVAHAEARACFSSDNEFGRWRVDNGHDHFGAHDCAALVGLGSNPEKARVAFENTTSVSYRLIWATEKDRYGNDAIPDANQKSTSTPSSEPAAEAKTKETDGGKQETSTSEQKPTLDIPPGPYPAPKDSRLYELYGREAGVVLCQYFQHWRKPKLFMRLQDDKGEAGKKNNRTKIHYLAKRCAMPDYPEALRADAEEWSNRLLYPHLPQKLLNQLPSTLSGIHKHHYHLIETERLFVLTPEFGVTDPPLVAFNAAHSIYQSVIHGKSSGATSSHSHKPSYSDDNGKPPIIVRGTQLWPAEIGAGYGYDDLRCAYNLAHDIVITFGEPKDAPMTTKSLKLRHVMSWLPGGYNSVGSSIAGTLKALTCVVQAYGTNKSDVMRAPPPSLKKLGE